MGREIHIRNYGVYVGREVGAQHHRAHAHIKHRGRRIASIFLETLTLYHVVERIPRDVLETIREQQDRLLETWEC